MTVLDASALLAFLQGERGSDTVEEALLGGGVVSAANWSETAQKVASRKADAGLALALLESYGLIIEPVTRADAERAADLWRTSPTLPLADRLCLALGHRLDRVVLTADTAWGASERVRQIR